MIHGLISSIFMFYIENPPDPGVGWNGTSWLLTGILDVGLVQILGTILWGLTVLLFVIAALVVVWVNRRKMFQHGEGVTEVLMPEESGSNVGEEMEKSPLMTATS